jgi:hypothetical protein
MQEWGPTDGGFDYAAFFWVLVGLFDHGEGANILHYFDT